MSEFLKIDSDLTEIKPKRHLMDIPSVPAEPMSFRAKMLFGISAVALFAMSFIGAVVFFCW